MGWVPDRYSELRALIWGARINEDVREELEAHLAMRIEDNVARGMSLQDARDEALARFGDVERFRRETKEIDVTMERRNRRMEWFGAIGREVRLAARTLLRAPAFTVVSILTLALGLGATTAVYTLLDRVVLRPLPLADADRLVFMNHRVPLISEDAEWGVSPGGHMDFVQKSRTLEVIGSYSPGERNMSTADGAARVRAASITHGVFDVLQARPVLGRLIESEDDVPGAPQLVVIGYDFWQRHFGGDPNVVGTILELEALPYEIIGVADEGVHLPDYRVDVWTALRLNPDPESFRNYHFLRTFGRMAPGQNLQSVHTELARLESFFPELYPSAYSTEFYTGTGFAIQVKPLREQVIGDIATVLWILVGAVGAVLLVGCANVANLLLARMESRRRERAVRSAIGAARSHLAMHSLTESLLITLSAGALGLWFAYFGVRTAVALAPDTLPRLDEIAVDARIAATSLGVALLIGIVFGLLPVIRATTNFGILRDSGRSSTPSRAQQRTRSVLVVAQVALSMVLLIAGGLLLRTFVSLQSIDPGFDAEGAVTFDASLPVGAFPTKESAVEFWRLAAERFAGIPGVQHVGFANALPLRDVGGCAALWATPAGREAGCLPTFAASPGFFEALGVQVQGRTPTWDDVQSGNGVAVVTRALADRLWPGLEPIGQGVRGNGPGDSYYRVIGVIDGLHGNALEGGESEGVYLPIAESAGPLWGPYRSMAVVLRTNRGDAASLLPPATAALRELDPRVPAANMATLQQIVDRSIARRIFALMLIGLAAVASLLLSAVGLYGVIAYIVGQRRNEIGIRMALGASASLVSRDVIAHAVALAGIGVVLGLVAAAFVTRVLTSMLFGVTPTDAPTMMFVSGGLLLVAALAAFGPAWRAAQVQPLEALRS